MRPFGFFRFRLIPLFLFLLVPVTAEPIDAFAAKGGGGGITPVSLSSRRDMSFGNYAASSSTPGTVVLSAYSDSTTVNGNVTSFGGTVRRAQFRITGQANRPVFVYLPTSATITRRSSSITMTLTNFTMDVQNPVVLNNQGRADINIGATLHLATSQTSGTYDRNNDFTVTVDYQ